MRIVLDLECRPYQEDLATALRRLSVVTVLLPMGADDPPLSITARKRLKRSSAQAARKEQIKRNGGRL